MTVRTVAQAIDAAREDEFRPAVLVVGDDAGKRLAVCAMLERLGLPVVEVDSGREALRAVSGRRFAVILMDVRHADDERL